MKPAVFPFRDLSDGSAWTLKPGLRLLAGGVPGMGLGDIGDALRLTKAPRGRTVAQCVNTKAPLYERLLRPFCVSVLNAQPEEAEASLLGAVLGQTLLKGERGSRAILAAKGLGTALVAPAQEAILREGGAIHTGTRIISVSDVSFCTNEIEIALTAKDRLVLAVPPWAARKLLKGLSTPTDHRAIVNLHYLLPPIKGVPDLDPPYLGFIGGLSQWLSVRGDVASVTISDAPETILSAPKEETAAKIWKEISQGLGRAGTPTPKFRMIIEKRATFAQTPAQVALRPGPRTQWANIFLAGDWTDTELPCTLEGAVLSGRRAARLALGRE